ncbi:sugar ABC transporter permease [Gryllotalpicola kribbensis]|uniref:Sugar ABC transporter permease n=1 Tax=Gryllotalpicola kribbensis TaxID=993084 RepID=A0ABP8AT82_9MICO
MADDTVALTTARRAGAGAGTPAPAPAPGRPRKRWTRLNWIGLGFAMPAIAYIGIFSIIPVVYGLVLSFTSYSPLSRSGPVFNGVSNYAHIFEDGDFWKSLWVTARYVLQVLPPTVVIALLLAVLVSRPFRGVGFVRSALYIPQIVSLTAVSMIWLWLYSQNGFVNEVLNAVGLSDQHWLISQSAALNAASVMRIWKALGSNMVLLMAGMQSIPKDLYEAARVDGANGWQQFRHVTLPGLRSMLVYVVAMDIIFLAQGFAEIYVLTQGGPLGSTTTANYLIYQQAFQYNQLGSASSMAFVLFALIAGVSLLSMRGMLGRRSS